MRNIDEINDLLEQLIKNDINRKNAELLFSSGKSASIENAAGNYLSKTRKIPLNFDLQDIKNLDGKYQQIIPCRDFSSFNSENRHFTSTLTPVNDIYGSLIGAYLIKLKVDDSGDTENTFVKDSQQQSNNCKIYIGAEEKQLTNTSKIAGVPVPAALSASSVVSKAANEVQGWLYTPEFGKAAVIQTSDNTSKVYIAEGIETAASIANLTCVNGQYTILASLGVGNLSSTLAYVKANFPPKCTVVLLRDHDKPDSEATAKFDQELEKFEKAGFTVVVKQPGTEDEDWNDVLQNGGLEKLEQEYAHTQLYKGKPAEDVKTKDNRKISALIKAYKQALYKKESAALQKDRINILIKCIEDLQEKLKDIPENIDVKYLTLLKKSQNALKKFGAYLNLNFEIILPDLDKTQNFAEKFEVVNNLFKQFEEMKPRYNIEDEYNKIREAINLLKKNSDLINLQFLKIAIRSTNPFYASIEETIRKEGSFIDSAKFFKEYIDPAKIKLQTSTPELSNQRKEISQNLNELSPMLRANAEEAKQNLNAVSKKYDDICGNKVLLHEQIYLHALSSLSDEEKAEFQAWINVINNNYKTGRSTSYFNFNNSTTPIRIIDRDSKQLETIEELRDIILTLSNLPFAAGDNVYLYAFEIACNLYTSFEVVIPNTNNTQEFDGVAFRDGNETILERKTNVGTGPAELQRNFLIHKMSDKMEFYKHLPESHYEIIIEPPTTVIAGNEEKVKALMQIAKDIAQTALKNKRIEFTFNRPAEKDIPYYAGVHNPKGYAISLRLSKEGKGDEKVVKGQLERAKEYVLHKPAPPNSLENTKTIEDTLPLPLIETHCNSESLSSSGMILAILSAAGAAVPSNFTNSYNTFQQKLPSRLEEMSDPLNEKNEALAIKNNTNENNKIDFQKEAGLVTSESEKDSRLNALVSDYEPRYKR